MNKVNKLLKIANFEFKLGNYKNAALLFSEVFKMSAPLGSDLSLHQKLIYCYLNTNQKKLALTHVEASLSITNLMISGTIPFSIIENQHFIFSKLKMFSDLSFRLKKELFHKPEFVFERDSTNDLEIKHSCMIQIIDTTNKNKALLHNMALDTSERLIENNDYENALFMSKYVFNNSETDDVYLKIKALDKIAKAYYKSLDIGKAMLSSKIALSFYNPENLGKLESSAKEEILDIKSNFMDILNFSTKSAATQESYQNECSELAKPLQENKLPYDNSESEFASEGNIFFEIYLETSRTNIQLDGFLPDSIKVSGDSTDNSESHL